MADFMLRLIVMIALVGAVLWMALGFNHLLYSFLP